MEVNEKTVSLPKFANVNGRLQSGYYDIKENDEIEMLNFYTVQQIAEFMDVMLNREMNIYVNNKLADMDTKVYENFSVIWTLETLELSDVEQYEKKTEDKNGSTELSYDSLPEEEEGEISAEAEETDEEIAGEDQTESPAAGSRPHSLKEPVKDAMAQAENTSIVVFVNGNRIAMSGKPAYVFVDVFDYIDFDLSKPKGKGIATILNGREAQYMETLLGGEKIEIYWKE